MTGSFILDYYILVFLASSGVFQMVGAWKAFVGMLYLKYRPGSFLLGLVLLIGSFTWFFLSEPRNVSDSAQGLNGNEQFAYFFAGSGTALAFTLLVSSLINWKSGAEESKWWAGLEALKHMGYLRVLYRAWRYALTTMVPKTSTKESTNKEPPSRSSTSFGRFALRLRMIARLVGHARRIGALR